jgi:hypothetical protein
VHHHEPAGRIDEDRLTAHTEQGEHSTLSRKDPGLIAIAEERCRDAGTEMALGPHACRFRDPGGRNDLLAAPISIVREQEAEPRVVAKHRVDATERGFLAGAIHQPCRVRLGPHRLPDLLRQVLGHRPANRVAQHEAEHLRLDRRIRKLGAGGLRPLVERRDRLDPAWAELQEGVSREPRHVVASRVDLDEAHARRHLQQVSQRGAPILRAREIRHVRRRRIVDGANPPLGDRDADEHRRHRLRHRPRREAMTVVAPVLVALDEDRIGARDDEAGGWVAREVAVKVGGRPLVVILDRRFRGGARQP